MDGGTQSRAQLDWVAIDEYAGAMRDGAIFPPIIVFYDGVDYWLADGFHRVRSAEKANLAELPADVRQGTRRDAILHSVSANADHGVRRTNRDKRQAVLMLLGDAEWGGWSDREVARRCGVSHVTVLNIRHELSVKNEQIQKPTTRKVSRNGKTYEMDTTAIGEKTEPEPLEAPLYKEWVNEWVWTFNPDTHVAHCKYCYERHNDWIHGTILDFDQPVWICERCDHATSDENMGGILSIEEWQAQQEDEQEEDETIPDYLPWNLVEIPVAPALPIVVHNKDSRFLADYAKDVHLVITSPPYNVGIEYDAHADELSTYYNLLRDIWQECYQVMVDGGRICVNVPFGVGRRPWVPMAFAVMQTLNDAGFTLRGQIIWDKGTTGNRTTWGSFRLPTDPGLRDTTECIIVAHKGQSNLEIPVEHRLKDGKGTHTAWLADSDYFMELAQDHWQIAPESAQRVKHPAPFPPELVRRLVHFYGFPGCHLLDPFGGSGTVGIVAKELGCQATLFEISQDYTTLAEKRISNA